MKSSRLLIEFQCPQCGGPATLEETDHLFACEFCRVKSFLLSRVFHYVLPNRAQQDKEILYFPYWRFKGMAFYCVTDGIKHKIVDVSHQAVSSQDFPVSVGLRSQTLKLRFVSPEIEGRFLKPSLPVKDMMNIIDQRFSISMPKPIYYQDFIGDTLSQIYSPFYVNGRVYDGVLNRPVSNEVGDDFDAASLPGGPPDWSIQFVPALCPNCGWDLNGERDSLALVCQNCNSLWYPGKDRLTKLKFGHIPDGQDNVTYLPFYRISAEVSGIDLDSYADLVKVANLPKVVQEDWKAMAFRFWSPAFKVRPEDFLRFSRNLTLSQPQQELTPELPDAKLYPVTLPVQEAAESLKLSLASFVKPRKILFPQLQEINIKAKGFVLLYIPFHEKGNELSCPPFRLRINKNLLAFARHL